MFQWQKVVAEDHTRKYMLNPRKNTNKIALDSFTRGKKDSRHFWSSQRKKKTITQMPDGTNLNPNTVANNICNNRAQGYNVWAWDSNRAPRNRKQRFRLSSANDCKTRELQQQHTPNIPATSLDKISQMTTEKKSWLSLLTFTTTNNTESNWAEHSWFIWMEMKERDG
jgi:hypothetical protein